MSNEINQINNIGEIEAIIAEKEEKMQSAYAEIGKRYFIRHSADAEEELVPLVDELVADSAVIEECKQRIEAIQNAPTCPNCGAAVHEDSVFCTACGNRLKEAETPAPESGVSVCARCGSEVKPGTRFCTVCGNPLETQPGEEIPQTRRYEPEPVAEPAPVVEEEPAPAVAEEPESKPEPAEDPYAVPAASVICPMCGKISAAGVRFCVGCGTRLAEDKPDPAPAVQDYGVRRCPNCGHVSANASMMFCTQCGTRLS